MSIYDICRIIFADERVACLLIFNKSLIFINTGWCCSIQDGIYHTLYVGISFVVRENFFEFICDEFHIQDFLWWCMEEHNIRRWDIISFSGGDAHHNTTLCILNIHHFLFSSSIRRLVPLIFLVSYSRMLLNPIWDSFVWIIHCFPHSNLLPTTIADNVVKVYSFFWFILFCFTWTIPGFPALGEHKSVSNNLSYGFPIRIIIRLEI